MRILIVNADDLGMSEGVNAGTEEAHRRGIVTSASLMVRRPAASAAVELARRLPRLAIGLHLEVEGGRFADDEGAAARAEEECWAQLAAFRELLGRNPTHLDSHHHVHMGAPVAAPARAIAAELKVPLRGESRGIGGGSDDPAIRYEGGFFGRTAEGEPNPGAITAERLAALVGALPSGWTELGCHPGIAVGSETSYAAERERELEALCDPRVRAALEEGEIQLRSFADFR